MSNEKRRDTLKLFAAGAPIAWATPVVNHVVLPAHAALSDCDSGWIVGDAIQNGSEEQLENTDTRCECEEQVRRLRPTATGASWGVLDSNSPRECYAEFDGGCADTNPAYVTKRFDQQIERCE